LIVLSKLILSAATFCFCIGYAARWRANALHRRWMALGVALVWLAVGVQVLGRAGLGLALPPAYWLVEALGSEGAAAGAAATQQTLGLLALLLLTVQAVLGRLRHPLHRPVAMLALPLWLAVWVSALFAYV
jgi:hypothetical protein